MNKLTNTKKGFLGQVSILMVVLLLCGWTRIGLAHEHKIDLQALTQETQKMSQEVNEITFVWWIPEEFWRISFDPTMTEAQTDEFIKVLRPYTFIAVVVGKVGPFGGITYRSESSIRADIQIKDSQGIRYRPLGEDKIDADAKDFLSMAKSILANMGGSMGENLCVILFPARKKEGQRIADAKGEGSLSVKLGEKEFRWRLPLGSLLPPKICPTCKEKLSGAYKFCPWDGTKLYKDKF